MLHITVPSREFYDESNGTFITIKEQTIALEHSLVSISKWESKWKKPFLSKSEEHEKTNEEVIDYIKCMTITQNVSDNLYSCLSDENIKAIDAYISDPMTATWIKQNKSGGRGQTITSELIYSWMISLNIPFECQKWHLNRLLMLIQVCNEENKAMSGDKKMSSKSIASQNAAINAARRKKYNLKG